MRLIMITTNISKVHLNQIIETIKMMEMKMLSSPLYKLDSVLNFSGKL